MQQDTVIPVADQLVCRLACFVLTDDRTAAGTLLSEASGDPGLMTVTLITMTQLAARLALSATGGDTRAAVELVSGLFDRDVRRVGA